MQKEWHTATKPLINNGTKFLQVSGTIKIRKNYNTLNYFKMLKRRGF